jgi:hypothetical protein
VDDDDREDFVNRLGTLATSEAVLVYVSSLIQKHLHLLVRTGKISLSRNMRSLMSCYAGDFNPAQAGSPASWACISEPVQVHCL